MAEFLLLALGTSLVNNFVLTNFLGLCPFAFILLIAANCTALGVAQLNVDRQHTLLESLVSGTR